MVRMELLLDSMRGFTFDVCVRSPRAHLHLIFAALPPFHESNESAEHIEQADPVTRGQACGTWLDWN